MRRTSLALALAAALVLPTTGFSQSEDEDDGGFIQRMLESALSAEGREVRLEGFRGALSSTAEIDRIVVTDPDGTWFTAEEVSMQWRRAALLRGRVNIDEIRIGRIDLPRMPLPAPQEAPTPEAGGPIALPELPVEIQLGALNIVTATLGAPILGEDLTLNISGSARLAGGEGNVALTIARQDRDGTFRVAGGFANETRVLAVDVEAREPQGGLIAGLAGLPGEPSLALTVLGEGPLDDFTADLGLATDGQDRVTGRVTLSGAPGASADVPAGQRFAAELAGDVTPLLDPIYHDFLGEDLSLSAAGLRSADGAFDLERLSLSAEALALDGTARIGSDGWPQDFDVDLTVAPTTGETVILPLPGDPTSLRSASLTADFDAAEGNRWAVQGQVSALDQSDFALRDITLDATGIIDRVGPSVDGVLELVADGLTLGDPALQAAAGERLSAALRVDWQPDRPVRISDIGIGGADYGLSGDLEVDGLGGALAVVLRPNLRVEAQSLARFAALSGLNLSGAADISLSGSVTPLEGSFDLAIDGTTQDVALDIPEADALLAGTGTIGVTATRDTAGLAVPRLQIATDAARVSGTAQVAQGTTEADLRAEVFDTSVASPSLSGPAVIAVTAAGRETQWDIDGVVDLPGQTDLTLNADLDTGSAADAVSTAAIAGQVGDLSVYSQLIGQPLSGTITLDADASGNLASQTGALRLDSRALNLRTGISQVDGLLRGGSDLALSVSRDPSGRILIDALDLAAAGITAQGSGALLGDAPGTVDMALRLPDVAPLVPGLTGSVALDASATTEGTTWDVVAKALLPGQTDLDITALVDTDTESPVESAVALNGQIGDLSAFAALAGQPLSGRVTLAADGRGDLATQSGQVRLTTALTALRTGIAQADALLAGDTDLVLSAERAADGTIRIDTLDLDAPGLTADGRGQMLGDAPGSVTLDVRLPDLGPIVPQLPGATALSLTGQQDGARWTVDANVDAPGDVAVKAGGSVAADASDVDLSVTGNAPLAIANGFLSGQTIDGPLSFDLAVRGAPGLDAVSGQVTIGNSRFSMPSAQLTLEDLRGTVALASGQAQLDITSRFADGGTLAVGGPVTLAAPFSGDLDIALRDAIITQADLLETRINGTVSLSGPLTGGARIGGDLLLDPLEIQIPSIGPSYSSLDGLTHENLPPEVRQTLLSAKLIQLPESGGPPPSFPIDLLVRAPQRVFIRGRGLDAELGGQIRVTGTTDNIVPVGEFELRRGTLDILTRDVSLDIAEIDIQGSFDPIMLVSASSTVDETEITISMTGPASDPELEMTSVPELPEDEVLSLFLFGTGIDNISPLQAVRLAGALRTLSGSGGLGFQSSIREGLGVDSFDIDIDEEGNAEASVGTYIGENIYTDVSVNSEGESEIELNLELSESTTVRGRSTSTGDSAIGIFFERDY